MLTVVLATMMSSCSSDSDGGGGGATAALGTVKAKVGGSNFTSMEMATTAQRISAGGVHMISIQGTFANTSSSKTIQIVLNGLTSANQTGTFEISQDMTITTVASYTEMPISNPMNAIVWAAPYDGSGVAGSVTITENTDTGIKGTFNFTGKNQDGTDTKQVTDGAFNVNWTN